MNEFRIDRGSVGPGGHSAADRPDGLRKERGVKMSAGNLIFLLLVAGGALAMFSMHRGGGHSHGMSGGGGHGHGSPDGEHPPKEPHDKEPRDEETKTLTDESDTQTHDHEAKADDGHRHRGC